MTCGSITPRWVGTFTEQHIAVVSPIADAPNRESICTHLIDSSGKNESMENGPASDNTSQSPLSEPYVKKSNVLKLEIPNGSSNINTSSVKSPVSQNA